MHDVLRDCQHRHARTPSFRPVLAARYGSGVTKVTTGFPLGGGGRLILSSAFPSALCASAAAAVVDQ